MCIQLNCMYILSIGLFIRYYYVLSFYWIQVEIKRKNQATRSNQGRHSCLFCVERPMAGHLRRIAWRSTASVIMCRHLPSLAVVCVAAAECAMCRLAAAGGRRYWFDGLLPVSTKEWWRPSTERSGSPSSSAGCGWCPTAGRLRHWHSTGHAADGRRGCVKFSGSSPAAATT